MTINTPETKALYDIMGSTVNPATITEADIRREAAEWNEALPSIEFSATDIELAVTGLRLLQSAR